MFLLLFLSVCADIKRHKLYDWLVDWPAHFRCSIINNFLVNTNTRGLLAELLAYMYNHGIN